MRPFASHQARFGVGAVTFSLTALAGLLAWPVDALGIEAPAAPSPSLATPLCLPFSFEANHGQAAGQFQFIAQGRGCAFLLAPDEAVIALAEPSAAAPQSSFGGLAGRVRASDSSVRVIRFRLAEADPRAQGHGLGRLAGHVNYLVGNDPSGWRTDVPTFPKIQFREVYPGVDVVYYGGNRQLEFDFVVAPQADPSRVAFVIQGADSVSVGENGDLVLRVGREELWQRRPVAYQIANSQRVPVDSRFHLADNNRVEFRLGDYDRGRTLVIDPVFSYATYFGGSGGEVAWDVAVDASGAVFFAGETSSANLLASAGAVQTNYAGGTTAGGDAFVAKLGPAGTNLVYLTYLGGSAHDGALALGLDGSGNAYLTGFTGSSNFPTAGVLKTNISGRPDTTFGVHPLEGFVTKLNAAGNALVYSAFLGGDDVDEGVGIAVDPVGQAYVAGLTESTNLPVANALQAQHGGAQDGFVAKLNTAGSAFEYFTYLGGTNRDYCSGIAADAAGYAYITGITRSTNFWITNAVQPQINNPSNTITTNINTLADAFVTKLTPSGALLYSSFLGGRSSDVGFRVAADAQGNAYVVGSTESGDFPLTTTNVDGTVWSNRALADAFVTKVAPYGGTNWIYSVAFGGTLADEAWDLALDAMGQAHLIGVTRSTNFPTRAVPVGGAATNNGITDVFLAGLSADGTVLSYSFYYGGPERDFGYGIEPGPANSLYIVGSTASTNLFVRNALQPVFAGGGGDGFVARLLQPPALAIQQGQSLVSLRWPAPMPEYLLEWNTAFPSNSWRTVPYLPIVSDGFHTVTLAPTNSPALFRLRLP